MVVGKFADTFLGVIDTPEEAGDLDCVTASYTGYVFPHLAAKSGDGWLWIGGLSSQFEDPLDAMKEIMDKLKCRYAYISVRFNVISNKNHTLVGYLFDDFRCSG